MKFIQLIIIAIAFPLVIHAQSKNEMNIKKDVVDYYWEMSSSDKDLISYPIEMKNNKWTSVSIADYEIPADVNYLKGYIFISDAANDSLDKASTFQFVIYERKKGDPIIAISKKRYQDDMWATEVSFWEKKGGKWFNVIQEVAPELTYQDFLEGGRDGFKLSDALIKMLPIHYDLPTKSSDHINVYLLNDYFAYYCHQVKPDDENCGIQNAIIYDQVELRWNKTKGAFVLVNFKKST